MAGAAPRPAAAAGALLPTLLLLSMVRPAAAKLAVPDADLYFKAWGHPDPDTYFFGPGARENHPYKLRKAEAAHVEELGLAELQEVTRRRGNADTFSGLCGGCVVALKVPRRCR